MRKSRRRKPPRKELGDVLVASSSSCSSSVEPRRLALDADSAFYLWALTANDERRLLSRLESNGPRNKFEDEDDYEPLAPPSFSSRLTPRKQAGPSLSPLQGRSYIHPLARNRLE